MLLERILIGPVFEIDIYGETAVMFVIEQKRNFNELKWKSVRSKKVHIESDQFSSRYPFLREFK